ncbi:Calcipressin-3 [Anabarilius grahami]|uniref:Calcipressin-3 n=1 Tax=Anabarilius grahami TaxID=495550 RepID=A0A3N0Y5W4_ANAGA|nr:Calcipressin-3 [Anabarilius grahami]
MMREGGKLWSNSSEGHSSDPEEDDEEEMAFGETEEDSEEMMDLSDLPTALFACSVHEAVFEEDRQRIHRGGAELGQAQPMTSREVELDVI